MSKISTVRKLSSLDSSARRASKVAPESPPAALSQTRVAASTRTAALDNASVNAAGKEGGL
jgi:hypothetical protein